MHLTVEQHQHNQSVGHSMAMVELQWSFQSNLPNVWDVTLEGSDRIALPLTNNEAISSPGKGTNSIMIAAKEDASCYLADAKWGD